MTIQKNKTTLSSSQLNPELEDSLSDKQLKILSFIEKEIAKTGCPPSYRDIAHHFDYGAVGTVQDHIRALVKKGYLLKEKGARGIRLAFRSAASTVPILGTVPAGHPIEAPQNVLGSLSIPARWRGELYALRVTGESMRDAGILDGDYIIVKKQNHAHSGEIVVALLGEEVTVKYLENKPGKIRLLPANPSFKPIELAQGPETVIQGKVIGIQRYFHTEN
ncbi:MAG: transcriptional repressor LexA [Bdellovibrio sp.]|nr:transcriptional repressor LexA [Bdellovibrio sp.]